jgi:hypothetical protein
MSWVFTGVWKQVRDFEREQARRLNEAYARWHKKHRELPHAVREQERTNFPEFHTSQALRK